MEASLKFYRDGLGLKTPGIIGAEYEYGAVVFIDLESGAKLALWPSRSLAKDSGVALIETGTPRISLGHNVRSRQEVDEVLAQACSAGAKVVKEAGETFRGGYAGYFQDPGQYLWEVLWDPQLLPND